MATPEALRREFLTTFRDLARHKHRYDVFRDFVTLTAAALHNGAVMDEAREIEYLNLIGTYDRADIDIFPKLLGLLVQLLEPEPCDILGPLYMELEIASRDQGQFFTPPELSELMARMTFGPEMLTRLEHESFITVSEPACGAGGMVLSMVKVLTEQGFDPAERLWVQCVDIDRLSALMCYVQLSLWNVPAEVIVGNTLTLETREVWHTPAHYAGFWSGRLARHAQKPDEADVPAEQAVIPVEPASNEPKDSAPSFDGSNPTKVPKAPQDFRVWVG